MSRASRIKETAIGFSVNTHGEFLWILYGFTWEEEINQEERFCFLLELESDTRLRDLSVSAGPL